MSSSRPFRRIGNKEVQLLMNVSKEQATRILQKVRKLCNKQKHEWVYLPEFCTAMKMPVDAVCAFFGWE